MGRKPEPNLRGYEQKPHIRPIPQASVPSNTKPFPTGGMVNAELAQGKFTFLSGEGWNPGPGVGLMPKAGAVSGNRLGGSSSQQRP